MASCVCISWALEVVAEWAHKETQFEEKQGGRSKQIESRMKTGWPWGKSIRRKLDGNGPYNVCSLWKVQPN